MKTFLLKRIIFTAVLLLTSITYGQNTLRGIISDSLNHEVLFGANIFLEKTALGCASDIEGQYVIKNIPDGRYVVKVSYIGYKGKELSFSISGGKSTVLNIKLAPDVVTGTEIVIEGQALGQMSAINQQRASNTIINVVSEEKIKELPDANAAESIGRLPGVSIIRSGGEANKVILRGLEDKFTNITIDGVKIPPTDATSRGVDLSMLSQNQLAGIELFKAITSDKDGDALAGSVNLVTKSAPEVRNLRVNLKGNYNDLMNSAKQYDVSFQYGERFFNKFLGVQLSGNLEQKIRSNERINVNYLQYQDPTVSTYYIDDFLLEFTDEVRKRSGANLMLDFNTPDNGTIRINTVYGRTKRDFFWSSRDYAATPTGGKANDGRPSYDFRDRQQEIRTFNSSIRGTNNLFGLALNWGISLAQSDSYFPFDYQMYFSEIDGTRATPEFKTGPEKLISYAVNNFSIAPLQWAYYNKQDNFDKERTAFLDIAKSYTIGSTFSGELKVGGKYKVKDRSNVRSQEYTPYYLGKYWSQYEYKANSSPTLKDFKGSYFEEWYNAGAGSIPVSLFLNNSPTRNVYDSYLLTPLVDKNKLHQWWELNKNGVDITGNISEVSNNPLMKYDDYDITERVSAGYIMNTLNIGQELTVIAGLRVEREDNSYLAKYMKNGAAGGFPLPIAILGDTTSSARQTVWLPNINLSYKPFEFMNVRVAAYKALARPDFNMRLDRYIAGRPAEQSGSSVVLVGNPNLRTAQAWNYEINTSFYGNDFGLVSLSAYYKEIKDMYHMLNNFVTMGDSVMQSFNIRWHNGFSLAETAYNLTLPYNSPKPTKVWGFEFEHQMNFLFLPGLLKNVVLSYNASIVRSQTVLYASRTITWWDSSGRRPIQKSKNVLVERHYKLEGMPEFFGNVSLGYDIGGFSGRISMFHQSKHDSSFSAVGLGDRTIMAYTRFDLALKQKITNNLSVFLNVSNLTNEEDAYVLENRRWNREMFDQSERYGRTAEFGIFMDF